MQPHRVGRPHLGECGQYGERGRGGGCRSRAAVPREKTYKLSLRAADVYFEIYLASRRMTHDLVKLIYFEIYLANGSRRMTHDLVELIYHLVAVLPKQLTLSLVKAPRLLYARGFNQPQIKTGDYVDCEIEERLLFTAKVEPHTTDTIRRSLSTIQV